MMSSEEIPDSTPVSSRTVGPKPLYIPECEILWEGGDGAAALNNGCQKNPGHTKFIPVDNLSVEHLPPGCQTHDNLDFVRNHCDATVKITVKTTSIHRPDTWPGSDRPYPYNYLKGCDRACRVGTGYIWDVDEAKFGRCPCHICVASVSEEMVHYMQVRVETATHVIYDAIEAETAVFECFYDSNDKTGVKFLYGIEIDNDYKRTGNLERCICDKVFIKCVTHDKEFMKKLQDLMDRRGSLDRPSFSFIASHPHGMSKQVTMGTLRYFTVREAKQFPLGVPCELDLLLERDKNHRGFSGRVPNCAQNENHNQINYVTQGQESQSDQRCNSKIENVDSETSSLNLTPGVEHELLGIPTFTLPHDANYVCRVSKDGPDVWLAFPQGTVFTLPDGSLLPPLTQFKPINTDPVWIIKTRRCLNYDIPTCPGSSGARISVDKVGESSLPWYLYLALPHAGVSLEDGTNQSSYGVGW